jgi:integrase/recombinase XerD
MSDDEAQANDRGEGIMRPGRTDGELGTGSERPQPPTNKGRKLPPEPLTPDEVRQLIGAASNRHSSGIRLRAMIAVMYGAGLRLAETLALYPRDIDTAAGTVRVREGKGRKYRTVGIDVYSCSLVDRWLDRRTQLGLNGRAPLFCTYERGEQRTNFGQPMSPRYVRTALARLGDKAGLDKRVHPHGLRHSLASDMADRGFNTHDIQAQLGHGSLATTDRYIRRLRPQGLIEAMRDRDWRD